MNDVNTEAASKAKKGNRVLTVAIGIVVLVAIAAGGYYFLSNRDMTTSATNEQADLLGTNGKGPVARVNGVEISREDYKVNTERLIASYTSQGMTFSNEDAPAVKEQVLTGLINRELVIGAAKQAGITVNPDALEAEWQKMVDSLGGEEGLATALASAGVTEDGLRTDLEKELVINQYIASKVNIGNVHVSDEEVTAYYEKAKSESSGTGLPPLEEVSELIKNQLLSEKQQQAIGVELERLRSTADIEILI